MNTKSIKICLAASAGGHMTQLLKVAESWQGHEVFYVTTTDVLWEKLSKLGEVYVVGECNHQHPVKVLKVMFKCISVILCQRPKIIISTGAAVGCMLCFLGKIMGAKVVWLDSITNVEKMSLSGRMVHCIADVLLVQWPDLAKRYKKAEYVGAVI